MPKKRLDVLLVERGLAETRAKAQALVLAGHVSASGTPATKPGTLMDEAAAIEVKQKDHPYVSRGGVKLSFALEHFHIDPAGMICLDIGASTGGFTDCLLQKGAKKVWAVDVGVNQLAYSLRMDSRVVSLEKTNARNLPLDMITDEIGLVTADVSFISLKLVIPPSLPFLAPGGRLALLVKPQFEAGPENVGKGGVVRDEKVRQEALEGIISYFSEAGLKFLGAVQSPITGAKGNVEFFVSFEKPG